MLTTEQVLLWILVGIVSLIGYELYDKKKIMVSEFILGVLGPAITFFLIARLTYDLVKKILDK